jgi:uncharacterized protein YxjI
MKRIFLALFSLLLQTQIAYADEKSIPLPNEIYVSEHILSYTTSFDIETKTQRLGTIYRRVFSLNTNYDFYDPNNLKVAEARAHFFSIMAKFDIVDQNNNAIGLIEEDFWSFLPSFKIFSADRSTKLADAHMNFWGTKFTITDAATDEEIGTMSRPFFRIKNRWTIKITDWPKIQAKGIDPLVLITTLAFQVDKEYLSRRHNNNDNNFYKATANMKIQETPKTVNTEILLNQVQTLEQELNLDAIPNPENAFLELVANELQDGYEQATASDKQMLDTAVQSFIDYCFAKAKADELPLEYKKAILILLRDRLEQEDAKV